MLSCSKHLLKLTFSLSACAALLLSINTTLLAGTITISFDNSAISSLNKTIGQYSTSDKNVPYRQYADCTNTSLPASWELQLLTGATMNLTATIKTNQEGTISSKTIKIPINFTGQKYYLDAQYTSEHKITENISNTVSSIGFSQNNPPVFTKDTENATPFYWKAFHLTIPVIELQTNYPLNLTSKSCTQTAYNLNPTHDVKIPFVSDMGLFGGQWVTGFSNCTVSGTTATCNYTEIAPS